MAKITTKIIISGREEDETLYNSNFYIKDYQRGYRWEAKQVESLLEDINAFSNEDPKLKYCLQPLIVKKVSEPTDKKSLSEIINKSRDSLIDDINWEKSHWELIDGQQRLTTIWLILNICNGTMANPKPLPYNIFYDNFRIIDEEYLKIAKETIEEWFERFGPTKEDKVDLIRRTLRTKVQFIWYEVDKNTNSNDVFKKINIGRIPLTNAELFKAQLLNRDLILSDGAIGESSTDLEKIAFEWDKIEQSLRDDDFWYFISNNDMEDRPRIDFLLELKAKQIQKEGIVDIKIQKDDPLFSFLVINDYLNKKCGEKDSNRSLFSLQIEIWKEIVQIHDTLKSFSKNQEYYHYIGFLVFVNAKMKESYIERLITNIEGKKKSEIKKMVLLDTYHVVKDINLDTLDCEIDKQKVRNVLLFFNIFTMIESLTDSKFSFKQFKDKDTAWDIEHIHARATEQEILKVTSPDKMRELLNGIREEFIRLKYYDEIKRIDNYIEENLTDKKSKVPPEQFLKFYRECTDLGGDFYENGIGNLTLLDSKTNRSYHNDLFPSKRREIIKRDKGEVFIPVCTKNVFLKMYTEKADNMTKWTSQDALDYKNAIQEALDRLKELVEEVNL